MYKLVLFLVVVVVIMTLQAVQLDQEMAVHTLFRAKHAVNRAAHAAAQQIDYDQLKTGLRTIKASDAEAAARAYLRENLRLDANLAPLPEAYLDSEVEWLVFDVIGGEHTFPFYYENEAYNFQATLHEPGIVLMVGVKYPRTYDVLPPISWVVKGVAELSVP